VSGVIRETDPFRWEGVPLLAYKEDSGTHFRGVTRQVLVRDPDHLGAELRYFEIAPRGHSTLEQHGHIHVVMVVRGRGACLLGDHVTRISAHDVVTVPPDTWHQFRAASDEPLGFLCLVRCDRDRPRRPTDADLAAIRAVHAAAEFIRV
jgi:quercetin dioxygenase-like cupin family protein